MEPIPTKDPNGLPLKAEVVDYLREFAAKYKLPGSSFVFFFNTINPCPSVRLNQNVKSVKRNPCNSPFKFIVETETMVFFSKQVSFKIFVFEQRVLSSIKGCYCNRGILKASCSIFFDIFGTRSLTDAL